MLECVSCVFFYFSTIHMATTMVTQAFTVWLGYNIHLNRTEKKKERVMKSDGKYFCKDESSIFSSTFSSLRSSLLLPIHMKRYSNKGKPWNDSKQWMALFWFLYSVSIKYHNNNVAIRMHPSTLSLYSRNASLLWSLYYATFMFV